MWKQLNVCVSRVAILTTGKEITNERWMICGLIQRLNSIKNALLKEDSSGHTFNKFT